MTREDHPRSPDSFLPLSAQVYHILLSLVDVNRHGYGIIQEVEERSGAAVRIGTGTLYTAIRRLVASGLVQETTDAPDPDNDDERRRYYRLTLQGRAVVRAEATRLEGMVAMARSKSVLT